MKTLTLLLCLLALSVRAEESRHRVFGLSDPGREFDLREHLKAVPEVELVALDLETAEATFRYDETKLLADSKKPATPEAIAKRLDELVKKASKNPVSGYVTFSLKPLSSVPKDQLERIEIQLGLPDCKGCRYTAYLACAKVEGVENVIVSETSLVTAWVRPSTSNRDFLIAALKKVRIELPTP